MGKTLGQDLKNMAKWFSIVVFGGAAGAGGALLTFDLIDKHYSNIGKGLPLMVDGVHLKAGNHNVVITDQFYDLLTYETPEEDHDLVINAFKEAYKNLNKYNSKVGFTLTTTVNELAEKYNLPKVSGAGKQDIPLYIHDGILEGNSHVMASTNWKYNQFNYEMEKLSITFKKHDLFAVWKMYDTVEETINPYNTAAYTVTAHETMHCMGFAHINDVESIMNTYLSSTSPKDFTKYDIEIMDKYNVQFYGAKSQLSKDEDENTKRQSNKQSYKIEDEEMAM